MTRGVSFLASAFILALASFVSIATGSPALAQTPQPGSGQETVVEDVEIRGNRRIPKESILYYVQSKPQDRFDLSLAQRDLQAIIQMGLFDPLATSSSSKTARAAARSLSSRSRSIRSSAIFNIAG